MTATPAVLRRARFTSLRTLQEHGCIVGFIEDAEAGQ
jgi:hypothetical protein